MAYKAYPLLAQKWMLSIRGWLRQNPVLILRCCIEACLVVTLAVTVYSMIPARYGSAAKNPKSDAGVMSLASHSTPAYEQVANRHLFGASAVTPAAMQAQSFDAGITLDGVIAAENEKDSLALIATGGDAQGYRVGQTLQDGETILHIEPAAIVLERLGQTRRVEMNIKYADSNAAFQKASLSGDDSSDWSQAYLGPSPDSMPGSGVKLNPTGIAIVPAANYTVGSTMSLKAIREARVGRFSQLKDAPIPRSHPPKSN